MEKAEKYQAPKVLVGDEYVALPDGATYDMTEQVIVERPTAIEKLSRRAVGHTPYWGPAASRRNLAETDTPDGLSFSA